MSDFKTFVVPYDFSPHSHAALETAVDLGRRLGASLHLVHVIELPAYAHGVGFYAGAAVPPFDTVGYRADAQAALNQVAEGVAGLPRKPEAHVFEGVGIVDVVLECARKHAADLIVMGTHGRTGLAHVFLGSVAERTLRRAPCPVLTVQVREDEEGE